MNHPQTTTQSIEELIDLNQDSTPKASFLTLGRKRLIASGIEPVLSQNLPHHTHVN